MPPNADYATWNEEYRAKNQSDTLSTFPTLTPTARSFASWLCTIPYIVDNPGVMHDVYIDFAKAPAANEPQQVFCSCCRQDAARVQEKLDAEDGMESSAASVSSSGTTAAGAASAVEAQWAARRALTKTPLRKRTPDGRAFYTPPRPFLLEEQGRTIEFRSDEDEQYLIITVRPVPVDFCEVVELVRGLTHHCRISWRNMQEIRVDGLRENVWSVMTRGGSWESECTCCRYEVCRFGRGRGRKRSAEDAFGGEEGVEG